MKRQRAPADWAASLARHLAEEIERSSPEGMGLLFRNDDVELKGCRFEDGNLIVTVGLDCGLGESRELILKPTGWRKAR